MTLQATILFGSICIHYLTWAVSFITELGNQNVSECNKMLGPCYSIDIQLFLYFSFFSVYPIAGLL